jgi:hypothetical protein
VLRDLPGPYLKQWVCKLITWMYENDLAAFRDNLMNVSISRFVLFKFIRKIILLAALVGTQERTFIYDFKILNIIWIKNVKIRQNVQRRENDYKTNKLIVTASNPSNREICTPQIFRLTRKEFCSLVFELITFMAKISIIFIS